MNKLKLNTFVVVLHLNCKPSLKMIANALNKTQKSPVYSSQTRHRRCEAVLHPCCFPLKCVSFSSYQFAFIAFPSGAGLLLFEIQLSVYPQVSAV